MDKHKWWHFLFINSSQSSERSTSYCGKYVWYHISYEMLECHKCKSFCLNLKDHKNDKHVVLKWIPFAEANQAIKKAKSES